MTLTPGVSRRTCRIRRDVLTAYRRRRRCRRWSRGIFLEKMDVRLIKTFAECLNDFITTIEVSRMGFGS
jgi:hypothetical protein